MSETISNADETEINVNARNVTENTSFIPRLDDALESVSSLMRTISSMSPKETRNRLSTEGAIQLQGYLAPNTGKSVQNLEDISFIHTITNLPTVTEKIQQLEALDAISVSYTHLTLPTTPYV